VDQLTHPRPIASCVTDAREPAEQINVIEQSLAKPGSGLVVALGDMPHDPGKIV